MNEKLQKKLRQTLVEENVEFNKPQSFRVSVPITIDNPKVFASKLKDIDTNAYEKYFGVDENEFDLIRAIDPDDVAKLIGAIIRSTSESEDMGIYVEEDDVIAQRF